MIRETKVPAIPEIRADNVTEVLRAIKSVLEVREGHLGDSLDQNVTLRDMVDLNLLKNTGSTTFTNGSSAVVIPSMAAPDGYNPYTDFTTPPAPTGLIITSGFSSIYLAWDGAPFKNPSFAEVWRASTNNLGDAVKIGTTAANLFTDPVGKTSQTYYYWIRFVSVANVTGPYNQTAGTVGGTGLVGGVDLSPLIITADKIATGAINLGGNKVTGLLANANMAVITDPTKIADSLIGNTKLADLAVDAAKLANSSVTATKIANLAVGTAAIQTGAITTALIANAAIGSAQIADAAITSAKIGNLAVGNAAIQNGAITNAKIADLTADKITAGNLTAAIGITTGQISGGVNTAFGFGSANFGTGFFLGLDSSVYKFRVGSYTNNMTWDGTNLNVTGNVAASTATFRGLTITDNGGNIILSSGGIPASVVTGLGALATQSSVSAGQVSGLGTLATQNSVTSGQVSGLGLLATANDVFIGSNVKIYNGLTYQTLNTNDFINVIQKMSSATIGNFMTATAITEAYIGNAAISSAKIQDAAIVTAKIFDGAITNAKIGDAAITSAKIGTAEISTLKISGEAVFVPRYGEQTSTGVNLTQGSLTGDLASVSTTISGLGSGETVRIIVMAVSQVYPSNADQTSLTYGIYVNNVLNTEISATFREWGISVANLGTFFVGNGTFTTSVKASCNNFAGGVTSKSNNNFVTRIVVMAGKR